MPADLTRLVKELSRADIEKLLAAKDELETLESRRQELLRELATVEKRLDKLAGQVARGAAGKKPGRKPRGRVAAKPTGKKTKKTVKKAVKKTARKVAKKAGRKPAGGGKVTVEDVVIKLIKKNRGPMPFKEILAAILEGKLVETRSKSFDNVLRRTLSTSEKIVNVSRGVYGLA